MEHTSSSGTVRLEIITDRQLVEDGCRQENRARYDQTRAPYPTPPMQSPLYETFTGEEAEEFSLALMEGRYNPPEGIDVPTQQFLSHCRFPKNHSPVSMEVTTSDSAQPMHRRRCSSSFQRLRRHLMPLSGQLNE